MSLVCTFLASLGPALVVVILYVTLPPAVAVAGPILVTLRSAGLRLSIVSKVIVWRLPKVQVPEMPLAELV